MQTAQPAITVHASRLPREQLGALLAAHEAALASRTGVLKDHRRTALTRVLLAEQWLCVKEYRPQGLRDRVKDLLGWSRARRAWRGAQRLAALGVAIPEPLALLKRGRTGYLVTRLIEGAQPLDRLLAGRFAGLVSPHEARARRAMSRQLGAWLRHVHDLGIYHNDWCPKNILAVEAAGRWAFIFLDFESVRPFRLLTKRRRLKNLAQICDTPAPVARTDRLRFLLAYAGGAAALRRSRLPAKVTAAVGRRVRSRELRRARLQHRSPSTRGKDGKQPS